MKESYKFLIQGMLLGLLIGLLIGLVMGCTTTKMVSSDLKTEGQETLSDAYTYSWQREYSAYLKGWNEGWNRAEPQSPAEYDYEIVWNEIWLFSPTSHIPIMLLTLASILIVSIVSLVVGVLVITRTIKTEKDN